MSTTLTITENTVAARVRYSEPPKDGSEASSKSVADPVTGENERNFEQKDHEGVLIENIRGKESLYNLDSAGFQFYRRPTRLAPSDFRDEDKVKGDYYPESIELIKEVTGASRVVLFDHTHRLRRPEEQETTRDRRQPLALAHVDQTTAASITRVRRHVPEEADELLKRRFQIINLWRPIGNPALDWPLALCDYRSVDAKNDLFPITLDFETYIGETIGVKYNPEHEWKYQRGMALDETVLVKCFDSVQDGSVAVFSPHTGFQDPTTPKDAPFRESIELRALVFYD